MIADQSGVRALGAERVVALHDLPGAWRVVQGFVDIFAVRTHDGAPTGRREFLLRREAGEALVGWRAPSGPDAMLLAVGGDDAALLPLAAAASAAPLIDAWAAACDHVLGDPPEEWADAIAVEGDAVLEAGRKLLAPGTRILWVSVRDGVVRDGGGATVEPGDGPVPLSGWRLLRAVRPSAVTIEATATLLAEERLASALEAWRERLHPRLMRLLTARETARIGDTQRRSAATHRRVADARERLAGAPRQQREIAPAPTAPPAWRALAAVAAAIGQPITLPASLGAVGQEGRGLHGVADACGVVLRRVRLEPGWWRHDHGPLLVQRTRDGHWIALVWRRGRYLGWDPATDAREPLGPAQADMMRPEALMPYRQFADGAVTARRLVAFGLRGAARPVAALLALALTGGLLALIVPVALGTLIERIIPYADRSAVGLMVAGLLAVALGNAAMALVRGFLTQQIEQRVEQSAQAAMIDRLLRLPVAVLRRFAIGDLAARVLTLQAIRQTLTGALLASALSGLAGLTNVALMIAYGGPLAWYGLTAAAVLAAGSVPLMLLQLRHERALAACRARADSIALQLVTGIAKLKAADAVGRGQALWADHYAAQRDAFVRTRRAGAGQAAFHAAAAPLSLALLYYGASRILFPAASDATAAAAIGVGGFLAFSAAWGQLLDGVSTLVQAISAALRIVPDYERARPLLTAAPEGGAGRVSPGLLSGRVEMMNVTFRYGAGRSPALRDLSFVVPPGQFVALVGASGSGKSTILRLLVGFDAPERGDILYDGKPLAALDLAAVRRQLGVVLQNGRMQPGSIFDAIVAGRPIGIDAAWEAARLAGLDQDIRAMPMAMHTILTDGAATLSGGQRQRLLIARALAGNPRLLLFDEATSALDNRTQAAVAQTLARLPLTRIVIAHRLSTIAGVDRVLVVDDGRIVQDGTVAALAAQDGPFRTMIARQRLG